MRNTIYKKIFFSFSIIIVLYTVLLLFVFISKELSRQRYESAVEVEFYLEREGARIDSQIETAIDSTQMLADNKKIQELANVKQNNYALFSDIFDQMKDNLFSGYQLGYNLGITQGINQKVVGLNGYFDFDDYLSFIGIPKDNPEIQEFFNDDDRYRIRIITVNQSIYLLRKIYQADNPASLYFIVNWDKQRLHAQENINELGKLYFQDSEASKKNLGDGISILSSLVPIKPQKSNLIGHKVESDNSIFWKFSNIVPSLAYVYIVPQKNLSRLPLDTVWVIVAVLVASLLLGSLLTLYFSRTNYRPYRKIISEIQHDDSGSVNVEILLKKIEDLKTGRADYDRFQASNIEDIREMFFKNVLLGKYPPNDLQRIASSVGLESLKSGGLIAILTIKGRSTDEENLKERELLKARQRIIEYGTDTKNIKLYVQPIDSGRFALIYSTKEQAGVLRRIEDLRNLLANNLHLESQFFLSVPFDTITDFASVFRDVFSLNTDSLFKPEQIIINRSLDKGNDFVYSVEAEQRLVHLVKARKIEEARNLVENILRTNYIEKRLTTHALEDLKQSLINTIKRITQLLGVDFADFYTNNQTLFEQLISTDSKELYRVFLTLFQEVFTAAKESEEEAQDIIKRVLEYIDINYKEDLSLSDLAENFKLTESYLSRLIKEGTGITFKSYLNQLKVNYAKKLLMEKKMKVNEVAESVGVKNVNTFIRMFKQYEGVTPGKYQTYGNEEK
ncbi:helix-turn-helix transcriptional regulator [Enterococcus sp. MJM12]|uniref:Helix-turn-helix transcriptional regulator n=1 Tax=Candidatus Enterococcus myersii TaxID=2815322 RepID=A0ABS3H763_9ENTE|nr:MULTISPECIES: AraC family transcriptional regulator [unclassified Enterococcus]MBO0449289.1 helix-turn-helix transcriptional regulator [Enterococcus sp. MJM12]